MNFLFYIDQMDKIFNKSIKGLKVYQGLNWFNDSKSKKRDQGVCG